MPRGEAAAQFQGLFVRGRQGLGVAAAGLERRHDGQGLVGHGGQIDLALEIAGDPVAVRRQPLRGRFHRDVLQAVQEGLQPGDGPHVGGVLVNLDLQIRLAPHPVLEEVLDEGVGAAAEIGDVDAVEPGVLTDQFRHPEDFLAEAPVHGLDFVQMVHLVHGQKVHGQGQHPQLPQFPVQVEVHAGVQGVVGPADEDHEAAVGRQGMPGFPGPGR